MPDPQTRAAIRALLAERRLYAHARFSTTTRRNAWRTIHQQKDNR